DRKSVGEGKRVDLGGRPFIKKKKKPDETTIPEPAAPYRQHELEIIYLLTHLDHIQFFFFSSRRRHTRLVSDWSSDVCSSDLTGPSPVAQCHPHRSADEPG